MSDPVRLLSSTRDSMARALLTSASAPDPTGDQRDALWSSLAAKLPGAVVSGAAGGAAGAALAKAATSKAIGTAMLLKGAVVIGLLGAVAAVGIARPWVTRPEAAAPIALASPASPPAPRAPVVAPAPPGPAPVPVVADPLPIAPEPVARKAPPRVAVAVAAAAAPSASAAVETPPPVASDAELALSAESASLVRSRQLLRSGACDQALGQLQQAGARFPGGALAQEREVLAIEALACAGRSAEASTRADAFVRANPTSAHAPKARRFIR